jgi:RNA polymerase sigma factor (sigma-70 family)
MAERKGYKPVKYTTHDEDKVLVIDALNGNQLAYNSLLRKYKPILYTAAKRRLPNYHVEDLEDVVMIVLGQAFIKIHQYDPDKSKFYTWMIACLHNYVNSIPKQKKRIYTDSLDEVYLSNIGEDQAIEYDIPDNDRFDVQLDAKEALRIVKDAIEKLPPHISEVMKLKFFEEYSDAEIAETVGCDKSLIYYRVKKGRELLEKTVDIDNLMNYF